MKTYCVKLTRPAGPSGVYEDIRCGLTEKQAARYARAHEADGWKAELIEETPLKKKI